MADELSTGLQEASFEGVRFPVESAQVDSGHDFAEHTAYGRRGADLEPTGQRAETGTLSIPCVNTPPLVARYGELFPSLYRTLIAQFEVTPIGRLQHPSRGLFPALIKSWHEEIDPADRSGVRLKVEWTEHNGEALVDVGPDGATPTDPATTASAQAAAADAAMAAALPSGGYTLTKPVVDESLSLLEGNSLPSFFDVQAAFRAMLGVADTNLALAALATAAAYAARGALEELRATIRALQDRYEPGAGARRLYTVPETMALWQVAVAVYGDSAREGLLLAANAIPDPLFVPAGTALTVLPDDGS